VAHTLDTQTPLVALHIPPCHLRSPLLRPWLCDLACLRCPSHHLWPGIETRDCCYPLALAESLPPRPSFAIASLLPPGPPGPATRDSYVLVAPDPPACTFSTSVRITDRQSTEPLRTRRSNAACSSSGISASVPRTCARTLLLNATTDSSTFTLLPRMCELLDCRIRSSPTSGGEGNEDQWRTLAATSMWNRLIRKGLASYDERTDVYWMPPQRARAD